MLSFLFGLPQLILLLAILASQFSSNSVQIKEKYNLNGYLVTHVFMTVLWVFVGLWVASIFLPVSFILGWVDLTLSIIGIVWLWQSWKAGKVQVWWEDVKSLYTTIKEKFGK